MYVTRPASVLRGSPEAAAAPPPCGPASGYLVLEESDEIVCCFGLRPPLPTHLTDVPFPQNRRLRLSHSLNGDSYHFYLVPVINQPLRSNQYYVVKGRGAAKGKIVSTYRGDTGCCFYSACCDSLKTFNVDDVCQRMEVVQMETCRFHPRPVASAGFPKGPPAESGWTIDAFAEKRCELGEALGMDEPLRARMPDLVVPDETRAGSSTTSPAMVVGRWYCPFLFVKEDGFKVGNQMEKSMFYEMTLEQFWEQVYEIELKGSGVVTVNVEVQTQKAMLHGNKEVSTAEINGTKWFTPSGSRGTRGGLGLNMVVMRRLIWEQWKAGWAERETTVKTVEEFPSKNNDRTKFRCFILVERFVLRRKDGSVALTYEFKHTKKSRCIWE